ncbi:MAG: M67 family metallopeptidase [Alphaproteobacteria bacterium]|nr:M67 family metallopeptidase [Alphaproteobacteria bacterium]
MKTLNLPTDLRDKILRHAVDSYPHEACGLLIGQGGQVRDVIPSPNLSDSPEKNFEIDPALIIHHQRKARAGSDSIIGHYHSHPDGAAQPSVRDQAQNYDSDLIWLIVRVTADSPQDMNAFASNVEGGSLAPIPLNCPPRAGTI